MTGPGSAWPLRHRLRFRALAKAMVLVCGPRALTRRGSFGLFTLALLGGSCSQPAAPPAAPAVGQTLADPVARRVYQLLEWRPAWDQAQAQALASAVADAPSHGLSAAAFNPGQAGGAGDAPTPDEHLTLTALAYAKALASGAVNPRKIED